MNAQQKDNSGTLWENSKKKKESQPDMTGSVTIAGVSYRVAACKKNLPGRKPFLSLAFSLPQEKPE